MSTKTEKDGFLSSVKRLVRSLPGRIVLIMLITWAISAIIPLILQINLTILPVALRWATVAGVGLAAGLAARWFLIQRTQALRLISSFLALSSGLWLSGYLTEGAVGYRLYPRSDIAVDWIGLAQLSLGCLAAGLTLYAWRISPLTKIAARKPSSRKSRLPVLSIRKRTPRKKLKPEKPSRPQKSTKIGRRLPISRKRVAAVSRRKPPAVARRSVHVVPRRIRANQRNFWDTQRIFWENMGATLSTGMRSLQMAGEAVQTSLRTAGRAVKYRFQETGRAVQRRLRSRSQATRAYLPHRKHSGLGESIGRFRNRQHDSRSALPSDSAVHLVGETEHRCPYCLQVVVRNDRRGVVICPICHTHHHADCWAITGTCQVPHQFE